MRSLGSVFLLLLLSIFGFGFLSAYCYDLYQQVVQIKAETEYLLTEMDALEAQYQALVTERDRLKQQVSALSAENANLLQRIQSLEAERETLSGQLRDLQTQLALLEKATPLLTWLDHKLAEGLVALLIVPLLPLSMRMVYVIARRHETHQTAILPKEAGIASQEFQAALTREEFHLLAQHRRSRRKYQPPLTFTEDGSSAAAHSRGYAE